MKIRYIKFFLGLSFFIVIFLVIFLERKIDNNLYRNYYITFNKIDGVQVGTEVLISGVRVGFVNMISLKNNYPVVSISVDKNIYLPEDSSIAIQTDGLFGAKFMLIEIGGSDKMIKENEFFSYYEDSILIEDLLNKIIELGESKKNEI